MEGERKDITIATRYKAPKTSFDLAEKVFSVGSNKRGAVVIHKQSYLWPCSDLGPVPGQGALTLK